MGALPQEGGPRSSRWHQMPATSAGGSASTCNPFKSPLNPMRLALSTCVEGRGGGCGGVVEGLRRGCGGAVEAGG
eukprot:1189299-Prorocentrum_minimum.AAC.1